MLITCRTDGCIPASISRCPRARNSLARRTIVPKVRLGRNFTSAMSITTGSPGAPAPAAETSVWTMRVFCSSRFLTRTRTITTLSLVSISVAGVEDMGPSLRSSRSSAASDVLDPAHRGRQCFGLARVAQRLGAGDQPLVVHLEQVLIKGLHTRFAAFDEAR